MTEKKSDILPCYEVSLNSEISDPACPVVPTTGIDKAGLDMDPAGPDVDKTNLSKQQKERYRQDTRHRGMLSYWVIGVVSIWLAGVLVLLFMNNSMGIALSDNVLIALLTTTTINILGLPLIILKSLFKE